MLNIFINSTDGKILATYPCDGLYLENGDSVIFNDTDYIVLRKQFNINTGSMEIFIQKKP